MKRKRSKLNGVDRSTEGEAASWEHLVPTAKGGGGKANLLLAHRSCNTRRGTEPLMDLDELRVVARRIWASWIELHQAPKRKRAA